MMTLSLLDFLRVAFPLLVIWLNLCYIVYCFFHKFKIFKRLQRLILVFLIIFYKICDQIKVACIKHPLYLLRITTDIMMIPTFTFGFNHCLWAIFMFFFSYFHSFTCIWFVPTSITYSRARLTFFPIIFLVQVWPFINLLFSLFLNITYNRYNFNLHYRILKSFIYKYINKYKLNS